MVQVKTLLEAVIGLVIGVTLYPVVADTITDANVSGTEGTLLDLIPLVYIKPINA
jgi:hypothetical protein